MAANARLVKLAPTLPLQDNFQSISKAQFWKMVRHHPQYREKMGLHHRHYPPLVHRQQQYQALVGHYRSDLPARRRL